MKRFEDIDYLVICAGIADVMYNLELATWDKRAGGPFYHQLRDYWVSIITNGRYCYI